MTRIYTVWLLKYVKLLMIYQWEISKILFDFKDHYTLHISLVNTELEGKNLIKYFGTEIWNAIPVNIKTATSLNGFKNRIKS